jgi:hypothetical protein
MISLVLLTAGLVLPLSRFAGEGRVRASVARRSRVAQELPSPGLRPASPASGRGESMPPSLVDQS